MAPDLAMLVLIAVYIGLVIFDTISAWSIERKSRRQAESFKASGAAAPAAVTSFRTRTSLFMMVFELCLCGLMMGAVATWYFYATSLVQDISFSTRWDSVSLGGSIRSARSVMLVQDISFSTRWDGGRRMALGG